MNLKDIKIYEENHKVIYCDKNQWWDDMWSNAARQIFEKIQQLGDDKFHEYQLKVNKYLDNYIDETGLCLSMKVIYAYGNKE